MVQQKLDGIVDDIVSMGETRKESMLTFRDFLRVIRFMREMVASAHHFELWQMFSRLDKARKGHLHQASIKNLINLLGIVPRTRQDQVGLGRIISESSHDIDFPEFERLVLKVKE